MKRWISLLIIPFILALLAACSSDGNSESSDSETSESAEGGDQELSDQLYIFNWSEYLPQEILDNFEEEFGVEIIYDTYNSNQEMLAKLSSGTVSYDLVVPSDFYARLLLEEGLIQEINYDNIPNYENIDDVWKNMPFDPENKYTVPYAFGYDGIAYNKEVIPNPPTSWEDLWNPEYEGKVIVMEEPKEVFNMLNQTLGFDPNDPTEEELEQAGEKLKELVPNLLAFDSTPEAQLVSGEAWIAYAYSGASAVAYQENEHVDFVLPEEGGIVWMDVMVIPANAQNKYTAEVFIDYMLRPEVSKLLTEDYPYGNPNTKAVELLDEDLKNSPGLNLPEEDIEKAVWTEPLDEKRTEIMNRLFQEAKME